MAPAPGDPGIAILAAGGATRMRGGDKLLETLDGVPLLRVLAQRALATGADVVVTLPPGSPRTGALEGLAVRRIVVLDAETGMAASFRALGTACAGRDVLVALGDMPEITSHHLARFLSSARTHPDRPLRATTQDGRAGQPVFFPARLVARFGTLAGDSGARDLLRGEDVVPIPLPGQAAVTDLDTPEAWADWRARTGIGP